MFKSFFQDSIQVGDLLRSYNEAYDYSYVYLIISIIVNVFECWDNVQCNIELQRAIVGKKLSSKINYPDIFSFNIYVVRRCH